MSIDLSELEALQQQVVDARNQMREKAKSLVHKGAQQIFEDYGDIVQEFGWIQYTPYFNDGDECVFGMHELQIKPAEFDEDAEEDYRWGETSRAFSSYDENRRIYGYDWDGKPRKAGPNFDQRYQDVYDACRAIYQTFSFDESLAKDIFGDHVRVIFTKDGVEVEEYSHE